MDSTIRSNTDKNYATINKFKQYTNILNNLEKDNIISKGVLKKMIDNTNNAINNTKKKLILLDKLEI